MRRDDPLYRGVVLMSVCNECCVLSGRDLCEGLIPCTAESSGCLSVASFLCFQVEVFSIG